MAYELVSKQVVYEGKKVSLELHTLRDAAGNEVVKEVCRHPGAVCVLAFVDDGTILLERNRRAAMGGEIVLELPAGTLEVGEAPALCAARELREETGFAAGRIAPVARFYTAPGILGEVMHAFAAFDLTPTPRALETGEEIEVVHVAYTEVLTMIRDGRLIDAKSIVDADDVRAKAANRRRGRPGPAPPARPMARLPTAGRPAARRSAPPSGR